MDQSPDLSTPLLFIASIIYFKVIDFFTEKRDAKDAGRKYNIPLGARGLLMMRRKNSDASNYWAGFLTCLQDPCDPIANPKGHIALCVAENKLIQKTMAMRLMHQGITNSAFSDPLVYNYNGFCGLPAARSTIAYFLQKHFWSKENLNEFKSNRTDHINPDNIVLGSGVASILNHLFYTLTSRGDVVLIPAPYYASFEYEAEVIAGCECYPVHPSNPTRPRVVDFDKVAKELAKGKMSRLYF